MYNKTIIEFGFHMISWIIKTSCLCHLPQPSASADNTDLGFDNSRYHAQPHPIIVYYNIASRATQSNSVYVSVLQISTVLADGVSKSLCQNFFRASGHCRRGEKYYISLQWWIQRLGPLVPKQTQFSGLFSWARVLKWGRKREKQRKRKLGISEVTIRFTVRKTLW